MKKRIKLLLVLIVVFLLALVKVNYECKSYAAIQERIIDKSNDIIEAEKIENKELTNIVNEMYNIIEAENEFEQAYLNHSCHVNEEDIKALGNVIYNEAKGCSKLEQSCVAWTVLNRCDRDNKSVKEIVSIPKQFAYKPNLKLKSDAAKTLLKECEELAKDVLIRHACEKDGIENVGRTLPNNYYSYWGDGKENHFRTNVGVYDYWDYSLGNPYI